MSETEIIFLSPPLRRLPESCQIYQVSKDCFHIVAGDWFRVIKFYPTAGQLVLLSNLENAQKTIASYSPGSLTLPSGKKLDVAQWQLVGVVRTLDRFVRGSFPIDQELAGECPN